MNLNQVTLTIKNMEESVNFYKTLGFTQIVAEDHYSRFECTEGNSTFSLYLGDPDSQSNSVIYFEHEQLDDLVKSLKSKGIEFLQEPTDKGHLWREAMLTDPAGNEIKLYWAGENRINPPWRVN
jgi:predicted enzyme related to lactoylglutathione lyase